jgi:tetratricopeptide (TPR) repeat protein
VERLRALGYVTSTTAGSVSTPPESLADPKDKIDVFNRLDDARVARRSGDTEAALTLLAAVLEEDPEVMLAHLMLGNIYLDAGEYEKSEAAFHAVMSRNDENLEGLFGLARAYQGLGRHREAARELERCLEIDPRQARAVRALAEVRLAMGQGRQVEQLIRDLSAEEQDESMNLLLASSLLLQKKNREALDILERIAQPGLDDEQVLLSLGSLFLKAGEGERAMAAYRRAVRAPPGGTVPSRLQAEVLNGVGHMLARQGDLSRSAEAFRKAVARDPSLASGDNNLGIVLAQMERFDAAERAFLQAIEKAPDFAEAYYNLGCLYIQTERRERAIRVLRRALDVKPDYGKARAKLEQALARVPDNR